MPKRRILNRHCPECEFQNQCRQKAIEKDDLSLLSGITEAARSSSRNKGIFTVTQLSYTFRSRRAPRRAKNPATPHYFALRALAIRENTVYIHGSPRFSKAETQVYRDFLALLLAEEVAHRRQTRLQRLTRKAHFPFFKTIDEFDFSLQSTLRQSLLGSYLGPDFVTEGRSLILYGKTGRGKTHLAVAIGYRAIQNGFETLCTTAAELVEDLSNASKEGRLQESLLTIPVLTF